MNFKSLTFILSLTVLVTNSCIEQNQGVLLDPNNKTDKTLDITLKEYSRINNIVRIKYNQLSDKEKSQVSFSEYSKLLAAKRSTALNIILDMHSQYSDFDVLQDKISSSEDSLINALGIPRWYWDEMEHSGNAIMEGRK